MFQKMDLQQCFLKQVRINQVYEIFLDLGKIKILAGWIQNVKSKDIIFNFFSSFLAHS